MLFAATSDDDAQEKGQKGPRVLFSSHVMEMANLLSRPHADFTSAFAGVAPHHAADMKPF